MKSAANEVENEIPGVNGESLLGTVIMQRRYQMNLSQLDLARRVGNVAPEYLSMVEHGRRNPSPQLVVRLADALGIDRRDLVRIAMKQAAPEWYEIVFDRKKNGGPKIGDMAVPEEDRSVIRKYLQLAAASKAIAMATIEQFHSQGATRRRR